MSTPEASPIESVLQESAWLRALARSLLEDDARAEDAVQNTLAAALEHPPIGGAPGRGWLARVLRNFAHQHHRARARREAREHLAAARGDEPSTLEVVERLALQKRVVEAVHALAEPCRTVIVLRFLDGLPPREVARRTGAPVKTVHTRIQRGLARLRLTLDAEYGGRRDAWSTALLPFLPRALPGAAALSTGILLMSTKTILILSASTLVLVGFAVRRLASDDEPSLRSPAVSVRAGSNPLMQASGSPTSERDPIPSAQVDVVRAAADAEPALAPTVEVRMFAGVVVDENGLGVSGLHVQFQPTSQPDTPPRDDDQPVTSDAEGGFRMVLPEERGLLVASGRGYAPIVRPGIRPEIPPAPPRIVVALARSYGGIVVDAEGRPVEGAEVSIWLLRERAFELSGSTFLPPLAIATTAEGGAFRLDELGFTDGLRITASHPGHQSVTREAPGATDLALTLTLAALDDESSVVRGTVTDARGAPVADAHVALDAVTTRTGADGAFAITPKSGAEGGTLRAVHAGHMPVELELDGHEGPIVLVLGGAPLTIAGRVVDAAGEPIAGAQVWTFDGLGFGDVVQRMGEYDFHIAADVEALLSGRESGPGGREDRTDAEGRFELTGLLRADYALLAMHPLTQAASPPEAIPAGTSGVLLRLGGLEGVRAVGGRVESYGGEPLAGALIRVNRYFDLGGSSPRLRSADHDFYAVTDSEGRFRFAALQVERTELLLNGEIISIPQRLALASVVDLENVVFRVPALCHLRVFLDSEPLAAESLSLLDSRGEKVMMTIMAGSMTLGAQAMGLETGRSDLIQTDESAVTIVLYKDGLEVRRVPVELAPGAVNEVRL